jgi:hypothetical protein
MMLGAAIVTAGLLGLALYLGEWAFRARSASIHEGRLRKLVDLKPPPLRGQVDQGLADDGMTQVGTARSPGELTTLAERWGRRKRGEIVDERSHRALTEVFQGNGVVYVLYFDGDDRLSGYTFVGP